MNELIRHKNWWQRNWKWFISIASLFLVFSVLISSSNLGKKLSDIVKAYADPQLIEKALSKAQENEEVVQFLGTLKPLDKMAITQGIINYSNNDRTVDLYVHINGSKANGRMRVFAHWDKSGWKYDTIAVLSKELKKPIIIDSDKN